MLVFSKQRRFSKRLPRLWRVLPATVVIVATAALYVERVAPAGDGRRAKLLEGAVFWVGHPLTKQKEEFRNDAITAIAFSPDGKRLLLGRENGLASAVDARNGKLLTSFKAHDSEVIGILFRPGTATYITASTGGGIREWAVDGRQPVDFRADHLAHWTCAVVSPAGTLLALGSWRFSDGDSLSIYDANSGKRTRVLRAGKGVDAVAFSRDGSHVLCVAREEARVKMWDVAKGELVWSRGDERVVPGFAVDANYLSACAFGPGDEDYVMAIDSSWGESTFCICDVKTGTIRKEFSAVSGNAIFALSPDGKWLATDAYPPGVDIWDVKSGKLAHRVTGHREPIRCLAFSPDGRFVASGADDGTAIVWNLGTATKP